MTTSTIDPRTHSFVKNNYKSERGEGGGYQTDYFTTVPKTLQMVVYLRVWQYNRW